MDRYFEMITPDNSSSLSVVQLIEMHNESVESIWILQNRLHELSAEKEALWDDYEELTDHLHG